MRVFKLFFTFFIFLFIFFDLFSFNIYNFEKNMIQVEVRGEVVNEGTFKINSGSKFEDLLKIIELKENADISNYSLQEPLYNKQIIIIDNSVKNKISINTATFEDLCSLKGIGEKIANSIIEYRVLHNGFKYLEELLNIKGIGNKKFEQIKEQISL